MDDENRKSKYLGDISLGNFTELGLLCRMPTQAEIDNSKNFLFEVFGLFTKDQKLTNFLQFHDGIIISIDSKNVQKNPNLFISRINNIINENSNIPVATVIDNDDSMTSNTRQTVNKLLEDIIRTDISEIFIVNYSSDLSGLMQSDNISDVNKWINTTLKKTNNKFNKYKITNNRTNDNYVINKRKQIKEKTKILTSNTINANTLMRLFDDATLPIDVWDHYGRLRVVWCSIIKFGFEKTIDPKGWLCTAWKRYKTSIGHGDKWNYTLTRFWINIINGIQESAKYRTFRELYKNNPRIHSGKLFLEYYGNEIFSDHAKNNWIQPTKI